MFFFESIPWYTALMWVSILAGLITLNEITRRFKWVAVFVFIVLPLVLPFTLWQHTTGHGSSVSSWFHWAKVYSVIAACLIFMGIRYFPKLAKNKVMLTLPFVILALNMLEAIIREFQAVGFNGVVDGLMIVGGPWNYLNGIAGLLNIIAISGWFGIFVSKSKSKDMIWPDMLLPWIIGYDLWNFTYVYNVIGDHAFYAGAALLLACTIPALLIKKGAWLQHRAHTLGFWMLFVMSFPNFVDNSQFAVKSVHSPLPMWIISVLSLVVNVALVGCHFYRVIKFKKNPLKDEVYKDTPQYKEYAAQ